MDDNRASLFKRSKLYEKLPLEVPFRITISASNACNFKCSFCHHSIEKGNVSHDKFVPAIMDLDIFKLIIDQSVKFKEKVKVLGFDGFGEPLLNKKLPEMIAYANKKNIADKIVITTNAVLLDKELSDRLIEARVDEVIISIEGLTRQKYREVAKYDLDFEEFLNNIKYFYENKGNCKLYIKSIDISINSQEDLDIFYKTFGSICDKAYIESINPHFAGIKYEEVKNNFEKGTHGQPQCSVDVCPMPFYSMVISALGNVVICCRDVCDDVVLGNVKNESLVDIWTGEKLNKIILTHLEKRKSEIDICKSCEMLNYTSFPEDILDENTEELLKLYRKNILI